MAGFACAAPGVDPEPALLPAASRDWLPAEIERREARLAAIREARERLTVTLGRA